VINIDTVLFINQFIIAHLDDNMAHLFIKKLNSTEVEANLNVH